MSVAEDSRQQPRRKSSFKCGLRTKAVPHGAATGGRLKKNELKPPVSGRGIQSELESVLAGLKLRKTALHGGVAAPLEQPAWKHYNRQKSCVDIQTKQFPLLISPVRSISEPVPDCHTPSSSSPGLKPAVNKLTKPLVARKPKNATSDIFPVVGDHQKLPKVQTAPGNLWVPSTSPSAQGNILTEKEVDSAKPALCKKPKVAGKPQVTLQCSSPRDVLAPSKQFGIQKSGVVSVAAGHSPSTSSEDSLSPRSFNDSVGKTKLSALKDIFEAAPSQSSYIKEASDISFLQGQTLFSTFVSGKRSPRSLSPSESPKIRIKIIEGRNHNVVVHDSGEVSPPSGRESTDYDDVCVVFSADQEGSDMGHLTPQVTSTKDVDVTDRDSGLSSAPSLEESGQRLSIEGTLPGENCCVEWVDESPDAEHDTVIRQRSRSTSQAHRHSEPRKPRRVVTPKNRYWSNPERTIAVSSSVSYNYDDVELPQDDVNQEEWETDSDISEADADTVDGLREKSRHRLPRAPMPVPTSLPSSLPKMPPTEIETAQKVGLDPPPLLPRSASGSPKLPTRNVPTPPKGSPRDSPKSVRNNNSPVSSPSRRRKISLETSIPPPRHPIGLSLSRDSGGYSGSSTTSSHSDIRADTPPPVPPSRRRTSTEKAPWEAPAIPTRRKTSHGQESAPAPPLPPRTPVKVATSNGEPPPAPPRSRALSKVNKKELTPNTVVPLSPEAKNAAKQSKQKGGPKLPPRRKTFGNVVPPSFNGSEGKSLRLKSSINLQEGSNGKSPGGTNMLGEVPPPPPARNAGAGDDYIGPNPPLPEAPMPEGLRLRDSGYLDMDTSRVSGRSSTRDSASSDNYIDPHLDLASHPHHGGRRPPEPFGNLWVTSPLDGASSSDSDSKDDYLEIIESELPEGADGGIMSRSTSKRFIDEPLYQIYHCGAVARDVLGQQRDNESDDDGEIYGTYAADGDGEADSADATDIYATWEQLAKSKPSPAQMATTLQNVIRTSTGVRTLWGEMPEVQEQNLSATLTMDQRKFQEALFEIITSEASYLKSLDLLISHFMQAETFKPEVVSKSDKHVLFSNITSVRRISDQFMTELEAVWQAGCVLSPAMTNVIAKFATGPFQVYVTYCSNQVYQERRLKHLKYTQPAFREALYNLERSSLCHSLPMQSFLALPMQRITRLPLLVDAIYHRMSSDDPEYDTVVNALQALQKLVRQCNEGARQMENLEKMAEIDKWLDFKNIKRMPLVSAGRYLVKKGQLTHILKEAGGLIIKKKKEHLYLFLLNDLLLVTKRKSEDQYQVVDYASRINCHAEAMDEADLSRSLPHGVPASCRNVFIMALLENHDKKHTDFYFACDSPSERMRWVDAVTAAQQINDDERIYEAWACPQVQAIFRYVATEPDELSLEESDIVNVLRKMADGWYEGERIRDGERGWFPANHTVEIQSERVRARNLLQRYRLLTLNPHGIQQNVSTV